MPDLKRDLLIDELRREFPWTDHLDDDAVLAATDGLLSRAFVELRLAVRDLGRSIVNALDADRVRLGGLIRRLRRRAGW